MTPRPGSSRAAGNTLVARDGDRVTRLDNGKLMLVGGQTTADAASVTNSAELYNHVTGRFSATGSLITGRQDFAQSSLPNGRILVAGGFDADGTVLSSAELYTPLIADEVDTTITSGPDAVTNSTSATLTLPQPTLTAPSRAALMALLSPLARAGRPTARWQMADHNFQVHATDSLGNTDPTPANYDWTISPVPDTMITSSPPAATNSTSADFTFTSTVAGSTFECSLDNAAFAACTSPKSYTKLKVGNHNFRVRAIAGGNTDPTPASFDWTIDTKAPNTTITSSPSDVNEQSSAQPSLSLRPRRAAPLSVVWTAACLRLARVRGPLTPWLTENIHSKCGRSTRPGTRISRRRRPNHGQSTRLHRTRPSQRHRRTRRRARVQNSSLRPRRKKVRFSATWTVPDSLRARVVSLTPGFQSGIIISRCRRSMRPATSIRHRRASTGRLNEISIIRSESKAVTTGAGKPDPVYPQSSILSGENDLPATE